jgi:hypothetical protein
MAFVAKIFTGKNKSYPHQKKTGSKFMDKLFIWKNKANTSKSKSYPEPKKAGGEQGKKDGKPKKAGNKPEKAKSYRVLKKASGKLDKKDEKLINQFRKDALELRGLIEGFEKARDTFKETAGTPGIKRKRQLEIYWENERLLVEAKRFKGRDNAMGEVAVRGEEKVKEAIKKIDEFMEKSASEEEKRKHYPLIFPAREEQSLADSAQNKP